MFYFKIIVNYLNVFYIIFSIDRQIHYFYDTFVSQFHSMGLSFAKNVIQGNFTIFSSRVIEFI